MSKSKACDFKELCEFEKVCECRKVKYKIVVFEF